MDWNQNLEDKPVSTGNLPVHHLLFHKSHLIFLLYGSHFEMFLPKHQGQQSMIHEVFPPQINFFFILFFFKEFILGSLRSSGLETRYMRWSIADRFNWWLTATSGNIPIHLCCGLHLKCGITWARTEGRGHIDQIRAKVWRRLFLRAFTLRISKIVLFPR